MSNAQKNTRKRDHKPTWLDRLQNLQFPKFPTKEEQGKSDSGGMGARQPKKNAAQKKKTRRKMAKASRKINRRKRYQ